MERARFYPGVVAALDDLRTAGYRLGLCTNKPEVPAAKVLAHMKLARFFEAVVAGGTLDSRKPEPAMLHETVRQLGGGPVLYVGDSAVDAETAQRASVPFALFTQGYRRQAVDELKHDWAFDAFEELPAIVEQARRFQ